MEIGLIDPLSTPYWEHTFTLRNNTCKSLQIVRLQSSCGCTTLVLGSGPTGQTLPAGKSLALKVRLDSAHLRPGLVDKFVWVFVRESLAPATTIELSGQAPVLVRFSPAVLDFGRVAYGQSKTMALTATLDARLAATGISAQPVCSDPDIQVQPDKEPPSIATSSRGFLTRSYRATLSPNAYLGLLGGTVSFMAQIPANLPQQELAKRAAVVLSGTVVPLSGQVEGDVQAEPMAIAFGTIPAGRILRWQVVLSAASPEVLGHLKITCATPLLTAVLRSPDSRSGAAGSQGQKNPEPIRSGERYTLLLEVATGADMPPGILQTQVSITTQNGERLVRPITLDTLAPLTKK